MDEQTLMKAATEGNILKLHQLRSDDPSLLNKVMAMPIIDDSPLHLVALARKLEFVKLLLSMIAPASALQCNRQGVNALHLAAANGHVDVVTALLRFNQDLALTVDGAGCTPLHYAAYNGKSEVVRLLVSMNYALLKHVNVLGETALHVAVKSNQHQVLEVMEDIMLNVSGQSQFCEDVLMHVKNNLGYSVADLLVASSYKGYTFFQIYVSKVRESGQARVIARSTEMHSDQLNTGVETASLKDMEKFHKELIIVILALVATVTFQALINPPQSIWKDDADTPKLKDWLSISWCQTPQPC